MLVLFYPFLFYFILLLFCIDCWVWTHLAEEMTELWSSECRILERWSATDSSYVAMFGSSWKKGKKQMWNTETSISFKNIISVNARLAQTISHAKERFLERNASLWIWNPAWKKIKWIYSVAQVIFFFGTLFTCTGIKTGENRLVMQGGSQKICWLWLYRGSFTAEAWESRHMFTHLSAGGDNFRNDEHETWRAQVDMMESQLDWTELAANEMSPRRT